MKKKRDEWHERYHTMVRELGYRSEDIARITGNTEGSIRTSTQNNRELPRWVKFAIVVYEEAKKGNYDENNVIPRRKRKKN